MLLVGSAQHRLFFKFTLSYGASLQRTVDAWGRRFKDVTSCAPLGAYLLQPTQELY